MLTESKYTAPAALIVAHTLAKKATAIPMATGTSMPRRIRRRSRHAPLKNGAAE